MDKNDKGKSATFLAEGDGKAPADAKEKPLKGEAVLRYTRAVPAEAEPLRRELKTADLMKRDWRVPASRAAAVHLFGLTAVLSTSALVTAAGATGMLAGGVFAFLLSFPYRGLENLVHGAAHRDWFDGPGRIGPWQRRDLNDGLANLMAAIPVGQDVATFRKKHLSDHHGGFGASRDPCAERMRVHPDVAAGGLPSLGATLRQVPRETLAFYATVGSSPRRAAYALVWHFLVMIFPMAMLFGWGVATLAWAATFLPLFTLALPTVRTLAEVGEHDYSAGAEGLSMIERTFAHDGWGNRLIHMFGDSYHPEHHLCAAVPQYRLAEVRRRIMAVGMGRFLRRRRSILGPVESYE